MFADGLFWHRMYKELARYLLQHPGVRHWQAVVLTPRAGLPLGPVELFTEFLERRVTMVNLEELSRREALEPLEELLKLVVRPEVELAPMTLALVEQQPELSGLIVTKMWKRLPHLSLEEVMTIAGIQLAELSETRTSQQILAKGREEGWEEGLEQGGQRISSCCGAGSEVWRPSRAPHPRVEHYSAGGSGGDLDGFRIAGGSGGLVGPSSRRLNGIELQGEQPCRAMGGCEFGYSSPSARGRVTLSPAHRHHWLLHLSRELRQRWP